MYAIETKNLTKYYGKSLGIIDVNLEVGQGEIFGFIGPNGAGKSTTIRTLLNFLHPSYGEAKILGKDCFREPKEIKFEVGYLPSETNYYENMSVAEVLNYSAKFYKKDLKARINRLANYFELDLKKRIFHLSLGNKKKVGIILSLLHEPELLIMDEPTSGLDPLMQHQLFEILKEENKKGTTIFFSSHILSKVQELCRKVAIIKDGRIVDAGEIDKLMERQIKKVRIEFNDPEEIQDFSIEDVLETTKNEKSVDLIYVGKINELIQVLSGKDIHNLIIEEPSLEEIFMHYYEKE